MATGHLDQMARCSRDGKAWVPLVSVPELHQAITASGAGGQREAEAQQAAQVQLELERFRTLATHELFGVPVNANPRVFRQGFLAIASRFHPGRLKRDSHPMLVR